jgi:hypothetical protein
MQALIVTPGTPPNAALAIALQAAAQRAGASVETLVPATENDLRRRLAVAGGIDLLYFAGRGKARAAVGHATLDFESAAGSAARAVNVQHLGRMLAVPGGPRLVLLQPVESQGDFRGFADSMVAAGVRAAVVWPPVPAMQLLGDTARLMFQRWREGATLAEIAATAGPSGAVEYAGSEAEPPAALPPTPASIPAPPPASSESNQREAVLQAQLAAKRASGRFDVFLCHNGADKPAVRAIGRALKTRGILPWLDEWELPPGQPWQRLLEQQIESIRSAAVCVGSAGVGPWQEQELYGFLREFVARRAPVIPVLLPNAPQAPELPVFLRAMTWVDFRQQEVDPLERLEWGITGIRPAYD